MANNFLTQRFCIRNHPICQLEYKFKLIYVMGLGEFMYYISKKDARAKLVCDVWVLSILNKIPSSYWSQSEDFCKIKDAVSLKRDGFHFFSLRKMFLFDCLYLVSKLNTNLVEYAYSFLRGKVGMVSKYTLQEIHSNWNNLNKINLHFNLVKHKEDSESFNGRQLKRVLVVATMTAGKSTLINAIMGYRINKSETTACTNKLCYLYNKLSEDGIIVKGLNGSYLYSVGIDSSKLGEFDAAALHFNSSLSSNRICFIDSPGVNYHSVEHRDITYKAVRENHYDALLFISNSSYLGTNDELEFLQYVLKTSRKPIVFVVNKLDTLREKYDSIPKMLKNFEELLIQHNCRSKVLPVSAEAALYSKLKNIYDIDDKIEYEHYQRKFQNHYYDLPFYCNGKKSRTFIEKTGILLLENTLKNILK